MNYIYQYYQQIQEGTVTVGKWIRLWYGLIVQGIEDKTYIFNQKKANAAIVFIENFCRHHEGQLAPGKLKLELWQKAFLSVVFGILDEDGHRQFREVVLIVARKNGKTLFAAAIAAYCAFIDGEYGARVYFAAPKLEQAGLCFDAFCQMIYKEPVLDKISQKRRTDIYIKESNSSARPLAFNHKKSDGLNISLCVADEISSWQGDQGLKFYEVIKSSFGSRTQPLLVSISTAGYVNDGVYDELMKRSTRVILGDSKEKRLAPFIYQIDDTSKWNDINELQKSNPNLGVSVSVDYLLEEIAIAEGSLSKKAEFLTKYCNIKQNSSIAWLDTQDVDQCFGDHIELSDFRDSYCVAGIDLSQTTDLTACTCVIEKDEILYVFAQFFLPEERIEKNTARDGIPYQKYIERGILTVSGENYVDYNDCFQWFVKLVEEYQIYPLKVGYDRYSAKYLISDMEQYGFQCDDVFQGYNLTPVINEAEGLIKDRKIFCGDNDLLKMHFLDTAIKNYTDRNKKQIIKVNGNVHIDGVAAFLDALTVRQKWYDQIGEQLTNKGE